MNPSNPHPDDLPRWLEGMPLNSPEEIQSFDSALKAWCQTDLGQKAVAQQIAVDALVRQRLMEVEIPSGLVLSIQQALMRAQSITDSPIETRSLESAIQEPPVAEMPHVELASSKLNTGDPSEQRSARDRREHRGGRRWVAWTTVASLLIVVVGSAVAWRFWFEPRPTGRNEVAQSSLVWAEQLDSSGWSAVDSLVLNEAPVPEELGVVPLRFAHLVTDWDADSVVYDLAGPERSLALLYVIEVDRRFAVPDRFRTEPDYTTGRHAVGSMCRDGRLYVLMVEGDAQRYRTWLKGIGPLG